MASAIIVDDEIAGRESLSMLLGEYLPEVKILGKAESVKTAIEQINKYKPDIVFLDVEMPEKDGFSLIEETKPANFEVIFTTAHPEYAIKAIKASAIDYLLKPIDHNELIEAVKKVEIKKGLGNKKLETFVSQINSTKHQPQIAISTLEGLIFIKLANIIYCRGDGAYTFFILKTGEKIIASKNLKEYENLICGKEFFRSHKSYIVNLAEIKKFVKNNGCYTLMTNGDKIDVSKRRKESFVKALAQY
ncbi:MAG: response regulator transcription factor [Bacteroidetes bacterium]|nr:response regulator transcription factor [Bacteroidota bacterium]